MRIERLEDGFEVHLSADELKILAWAEKKDPNEVLSLFQHWLNHRQVAMNNGESKDLKAAFDQLPEDLKAKIREKINELGSQNR